MTLIPNLLMTGILAIITSIAFLVWAAVFIERRDGGVVLIALSVLLLCVGGGFGPPLIGLILGVAALTMNRASSTKRAAAPGFWRLLADQWPWLFGTALAAWLMLFPGVVIVSYLFGWDESSRAFTVAVFVLILAAFGLLLLAITTGFARDAQATATTSGYYRQPGFP